MMLIKELPVPPGVRDHSLHDVVLRDEVDEILFIVLHPFLHFFQRKDIGHPVVHLESVLGKDGDGGNVLRLCPERKVMIVYVRSRNALPRTTAAKPTAKTIFPSADDGVSAFSIFFGRNIPVLSHVRAIGLFMGIQHPPLFVFGKEIIDQRHDEPEHDRQKPRPEDREPETGNPEREILRDAG